MHEYVGKHSKMHKSEESQIGGTKQERQAYKHCMEWRKVCIKHTNTTEVYLTSGYTLGGWMWPHKQTHGGHKAWQSLDLDR